jgi:hypothetical protein
MGKGKGKNKTTGSNAGSKSVDPDMEFLDACIKENKLLEEQMNLNPDKSPLEKSIDDIKKSEIKKKLRNSIYMKTQMRGAPPKKEIETQEKLINEMMKHPKMTNEILHLYGKAIEFNPKKTLPNPVEIFDNDEKYRIEYYQYILGIIEALKKENKNINFLDKVLDNPYGHYISRCLNCPLNPFNKYDKSNNVLSNISNI